jgi:hypothetical protein
MADNNLKRGDRVQVKIKGEIKYGTFVGYFERLSVRNQPTYAVVALDHIQVPGEKQHTHDFSPNRVKRVEVI